MIILFPVWAEDPDRGSINGLEFALLLSFFNSFTLSEYLKVFKVCSQDPLAGEILAIMTVRQFPPVKESFKTYVSLLPLNGRCFFAWSRARIHSFRAKRDLLISAPSTLLCLPESDVSAPLSEPARSMKLIFPKFFPFGSLSEIYRMAWDLDESLFAPVVPVVRALSP